MDIKKKIWGENTFFRFPPLTFSMDQFKQRQKSESTKLKNNKLINYLTCTVDICLYHLIMNLRAFGLGQLAAHKLICMCLCFSLSLQVVSSIWAVRILLAATHWVFSTNWTIYWNKKRTLNTLKTWKHKEETWRKRINYHLVIYPLKFYV